MRKFGEFFEDDQQHDPGAQQAEALTPENSIIIPEGQQPEDNSIGTPGLAIQFDSTKHHDPAVQQQNTQTEVQDAPLTPVLGSVTPVVIPGLTPVQPIQNVVTAQQPAKPGQQHNFKPAHRPAAPAAKRRNRFAGHEPFNNLVRTDWMRAIDDDPYAFDGLVYLPSIAEVPAAARGDFEHAAFTEINNNQRELTYSDPHPIVLLDCPDERENFFALDVDSEQDGYVDEFQVLRIAATGIPIGSVIEWNEEQASGEALPRWWYVMKIFAYGTASVGSLYFCVPARNFEGKTK